MSKKQPLISVVTPSYNLGDHIEKTIRSVLEQDYKNFEYLVIDGGSTDKTISILKKFSKNKKYKEKFAWISEPDRGQTDAINKGFKMSSGQWFAFINADDFYEPNVFSKLAPYLIKYSTAGIVYGNCYLQYSDKKILKIPPENITYQRLVHSNEIPGPAVFYNRFLLKKIGGFDRTLKIWMDYDVFLKLSKISRLQYIKLNIANFLIREEQKSDQSLAFNYKEAHLVSVKNGGSFFSKQLINRFPFPFNKMGKFLASKIFKNKILNT